MLFYGRQDAAHALLNSISALEALERIERTLQPLRIAMLFVKIALAILLVLAAAVVLFGLLSHFSH